MSRPKKVLQSLRVSVSRLEACPDWEVAGYPGAVLAGVAGAGESLQLHAHAGALGCRRLQPCLRAAGEVG